MSVVEIVIAVTGAIACCSLILLFLQRRAFGRQLAALRQEMLANQLACYGMAKHVRSLQRVLDGVDGNNTSAPADGADVAARRASESRESTGSSRGARENAALDAAEDLIAAGADTARLADELGVSRTEAEIIAHIRPLGRATAVNSNRRDIR
jgi:hypothetical protein